MSGKLINAKINVTKINKDLLFKGEKGTWLDLTIWINEKPDQFGNDISIEQRTGKDEKKIYLGNGKFYVKKESERQNNESKVTEPATRESILNTPDAPPEDELSDLPF